MFRIDWVEGDEKCALAEGLTGTRPPVGAIIAILSEGDAFGASCIELESNAARISLFVLPSRRKQGFGDLLLRTAVLKCASCGAHAITLMVPQELSAWPQRLGFSDSGRVQNGFSELFAYPEDIEWSACCR